VESVCELLLLPQRELELVLLRAARDVGQPHAGELVVARALGLIEVPDQLGRDRPPRARVFGGGHDLALEAGKRVGDLGRLGLLQRELGVELGGVRVVLVLHRAERELQRLQVGQRLDVALLLLVRRRALGVVGRLCVVGGARNLERAQVLEDLALQHGVELEARAVRLLGRLDLLAQLRHHLVGRQLLLLGERVGAVEAHVKIVVRVVVVVVVVVHAVGGGVGVVVDELAIDAALRTNPALLLLLLFLFFLLHAAVRVEHAVVLGGRLAAIVVVGVGVGVAQVGLRVGVGVVGVVGVVGERILLARLLALPLHRLHLALVCLGLVGVVGRAAVGVRSVGLVAFRRLHVGRLARLCRFVSGSDSIGIGRLAPIRVALFRALLPSRRLRGGSAAVDVARVVNLRLLGRALVLGRLRLTVGLRSK
jgi:hypothetical protein